MYLYLHRNDKMNSRANDGSSKNRTDLGEMLVYEALKDYRGREKGVLTARAPDGITIRREENGKPYFVGLPPGDSPIHFSVSHSGDLWGCIMAGEQVGFDMELIRDNVDYIKIAGRFFAKDEYRLIQSVGPEAFFEIWVRKEAYVKYLGTGLSERLSGFSTAAPGKMTRGDTSCFILPCEAGQGVKAAYCCASGTGIRDTIYLEGKK